MLRPQILLVVVYSFCGMHIFGQANNNYQLTWSDEFNKDGKPDPSNWNFENGFIRNFEDQWYQSQNAFCKNGMLIIEAKKESRPNPWYVRGSVDWRKKRDSIHYTSACLVTKGLHAWKFGRFVMRGKIDINDGMWPAWWTLGTHGHWPANGEIDIMEYYRNMLLANVACPGKGNHTKWFSKRFNVDSMGGKKWGDSFHIWRMDWDDKNISLFVDDHLLNKVPLDSLVNQDASGVTPFKQPQYMLLNLAIGGSSGGDPAHTSFPRKFEIDYVRVYQKIK